MPSMIVSIGDLDLLGDAVGPLAGEEALLHRAAGRRRRQGPRRRCRAGRAGRPWRPGVVLLDPGVEGGAPAGGDRRRARHRAAQGQREGLGGHGRTARPLRPRGDAGTSTDRAAAAASALARAARSASTAARSSAPRGSLLAGDRRRRPAAGQRGRCARRHVDAARRVGHAVARSCRRTASGSTGHCPRRCGSGRGSAALPLVVRRRARCGNPDRAHDGTGSGVLDSSVRKRDGHRRGLAVAPTPARSAASRIAPG